MDIVGDIKKTFKEGSALTKLIYINLGVFLLIKIIGVFFYLSGQSFPVLASTDGARSGRCDQTRFHSVRSCLLRLGTTVGSKAGSEPGGSSLVTEKFGSAPQ